MAFLHTIVTNGITIPFDLKRNTRSKSIRISVFGDGRILVSAPPRLKEQEILKFVRTKAPWILQTLSAHGHHLPSFTPTPSEPLQPQDQQPGSCLPDLQDGDFVLYLGSPHLVRISVDLGNDSKGSVRLEGTTFDIKTTSKLTARTLLTNWFRVQAQELFTERTHYWSKVLKLSPTHLDIRSQKTRWGSCSTKTGALHFNWKVLMAPSEVIDYLIVHELCHLQVPNHSSDFWQLVQTFLPDYKTRRKWLTENGASLDF